MNLSDIGIWTLSTPGNSLPKIFCARYKKTSVSPRWFFWSNRIKRQSRQFFFDTRSFTGQVTQVVEFGLTHVTATLQLYALNLGRVSLESTLNAHTVRNL